MTHQKNKRIKKVLYVAALIALLIGVTVGAGSKVAGSKKACCCPYTKTQQYGGEGGDIFSDDLTQVVKIKSISIRHGRYVDAIQTTWLLTSGQLYQGPRHGGGGGTESNINLNDDEFITRIAGGAGRYIDQLTFYTNKGNKFGPFGGDGGKSFEIGNLYAGGFFGRSGRYLDAIGIFTGDKPAGIQKSK